MIVQQSFNNQSERKMNEEHFLTPLFDRAVKLTSPAARVRQGIKNGKSGLKIEKPLVVYDDNGNYVDEVRKMFGVDSDVAEKL